LITFKTIDQAMYAKQYLRNEAVNGKILKVDVQLKDRKAGPLH
jgi:hypothetical protein